jgi:hypothetical protein
MSNEQRYFDALRKITRYQTVEQLRKHGQKDWGLPFEEVLEYSYENVIQEAKNAVRGRRRPKE